jgi:hypothetical protein
MQIANQLTHLKHTHDATAIVVSPAARQGGTVERSSSKVRLARGIDAPRVRSASLESYAPLRAGSASLEASTLPRAGSASPEGRTPPRAGSASPEGPNAPSSGVRLARETLPARCPRSCPRVRAFNALTPQDARRDFGTPGNRVPALFHQLPGGSHPCRCATLCGEAGVSSVTLCRLPPYG